MAASAGARLDLIAESFARLSGAPLVEASESATEAALWSAPRAIVAHGTETDPRFFYANCLALGLFAMPAPDFIGLPSQRSAEPVLRDERAAMLARLERDDLVDDYCGIRIASTGGRFRIERAMVWNLRDEGGACHGQAATFAEWRWL